MLKVDNLKKSFGENVVFSKFSQEFNTGDVYAIIGDNGSGKSTLFNLIGGFYPPDEGQIYLNGDSIIGLSPDRVAELGVSRCFQSIRLSGSLTVMDNVVLSIQGTETEQYTRSLFASRHMSSLSKAAIYKAEKILDSCFLDGVSGQFAAEVSYGQQRLLGLACCIAQQAIVYLLDEPTAGVSDKFTGKIADIIKNQLFAQNRTILVIDHKEKFIRSVSDKAVYM